MLYLSSVYGKFAGKILRFPQYMNHRKNNAEEVTCKGCVGCNVFHVCVDPGDFCTYRWLPRTHIVQGKKEDSENRQEQKRTRNS